jgi:hypothetical protein
MHKLGVFAIISIALVAVASPTFAGETAYIADLKGASEVPPTDSKATGKADFTYDDASKKLTWKSPIGD